MGRVARYKKVKSCDPYSKRNGGNVDLSTVGVWGLGDDGRRVKKKSLTVQRLKKAKELKRMNKLAKSNSNDIGGGGGKKKKNKHSSLDDIMNGKKGSGFDLPPDDVQDEFDLNDLVGSVKKQKMDIQGTGNNSNNNSNNNKNHEKDDNTNTTSNTKVSSKASSLDPSYINMTTDSGLVASIPKTDEDEMKVMKILKLDQQIQSKLDEKKQESYRRMDGESKRAFNRRTKAETRQIIHHSTVKKNLEKLQKKKEFLNNKKKNKKGKRSSTVAAATGSYQNNGGRGGDDDDDDTDYNDSTGGFVTGERAAALAASASASSSSDDPVLFGEQAERPPSFKHLPRGAVDKNRKQHSIHGNSNNNGSNGGNHRNGKTTMMTRDEICAEQDAMELMRRKVQAQYAMIKSKRRQAGDFHL